MPNLFTKILKTQKTIIEPRDLLLDGEVLLIGKKIEAKVKKLFRGSLAIREVDAGSSNACEHELTALSNCFYDSERFGIHFVASPRHADMLMVTGPVSRNMEKALIKTYEATPDPKIVVAVGDDAIDGGIFKGSYAVLDGVNKVIPVNYSIPGDPPTPKAILLALLEILEKIETKTKIAKDN
ncbi:MAG: NADH-quinone oxidoreductase subunit NuoB [Patescibacteria group bacterium]|jgi:Ni,Fe-hydrogenase III small subunit